MSREIKCKIKPTVDVTIVTWSTTLISSGGDQEDTSYSQMATGGWAEAHSSHHICLTVACLKKLEIVLARPLGKTKSTNRCQKNNILKTTRLTKAVLSGQYCCVPCVWFESVREAWHQHFTSRVTFLCNQFQWHLLDSMVEASPNSVLHQVYFPTPIFRFWTTTCFPCQNPYFLVFFQVSTFVVTTTILITILGYKAWIFYTTEYFICLYCC